MGGKRSIKKGAVRVSNTARKKEERSWAYGQKGTEVSCSAGGDILMQRVVCNWEVEGQKDKKRL